jgi:hypothetical protein
MIVVATQLVLDTWTSFNFLGETIMSTGMSGHTDCVLGC